MAEGPENIPTTSQMGGIIPHFYYDVIGRILPGTFFIVWLGILVFPADKLGELKCEFTPPVSEHSGAYLIFIGTLALFSLALSGYIAGLLLGSIAFLPLEQLKSCRRLLFIED